MVVVRLSDYFDHNRPHPHPEGSPESEEDDAIYVNFDGSPSELLKECGKLWVVVMLMAMRDKATSIHYHPWQGDSSFSYMIDNARHELVPPPAEYADVIVDVARSLFTPATSNWFSRWLRSRLGQTAGSEVCLDFECGAGSLWDAVCWRTGSRCGVELYLIKDCYLID